MVSYGFSAFNFHSFIAVYQSISFILQNQNVRLNIMGSCFKCSLNSTLLDCVAPAVHKSMCKFMSKVLQS